MCIVEHQKMRGSVPVTLETEDMLQLALSVTKFRLIQVNRRVLVISHAFIEILSISSVQQ